VACLLGGLAAAAPSASADPPPTAALQQRCAPGPFLLDTREIEKDLATAGQERNGLRKLLALQKAGRDDLRSVWSRADPASELADYGRLYLQQLDEQIERVERALASPSPTVEVPSFLSPWLGRFGLGYDAYTYEGSESNGAHQTITREAMQRPDFRLSHFHRDGFGLFFPWWGDSTVTPAPSTFFFVDPCVEDLYLNARNPRPPQRLAAVVLSRMTLEQLVRLTHQVVQLTVREERVGVFTRPRPQVTFGGGAIIERQIRRQDFFPSNCGRLIPRLCRPDLLYYPTLAQVFEAARRALQSTAR
jgi:hypothetical protein